MPQSNVSTKLKVLSTLVLFVFVAFLMLTTEIKAAEPFHITFQGDEADKFPAGWEATNNDSAAKIYTVKVEGGKKFLHADAHAQAMQVGVEHSFALRELPEFEWQWRALIFPEGTDEREKSHNDSVLAIYVVFGHWPFLSSIKYIWSDTLPVGTTFNSPTSASTKVVVVRSGRAQANEWITEKRNLLNDYRQLFGEKEKNPTASGIAVLTDADNTGTHASADYGDMEVFAPNGQDPRL
ncbi:MAG TPA: DUF3047 domain-containing protein [Syntrophorhabdaceae bacterium]|nr:DUF3047 domain-containing protein [Syntrophorhabdaceae bacterium]